MIEVAALLAATALAMALVPTAKRGNSKTPAGPFHTLQSMNHGLNDFDVLRIAAQVHRM
jgi:hypothetical protein